MHERLGGAKQQEEAVDRYRAEDGGGDGYAVGGVFGGAHHGVVAGLFCVGVRWW